MKKLLLFALFLPVAAWGQATNPSIIPGSPPATCGAEGSLPMYFDSSAQLWGCGAGNAFINITGGSGGAPAASLVSPGWLSYYGTGADGNNSNASGALVGIKNYLDFQVPFGNTVTVNTLNGLTVHAKTCEIYGSITAIGVWNSGSGPAAGGSSPGSGGGTAAGTAGESTFWSASASGQAAATGGTAGASNGGTGGNAQTPTQPSATRTVSIGGLGLDGQYLGGAKGQAGGSSGGAQGLGGGGITLICGSLSGNDGTHTGIIDASGTNAQPAAANTQGAGSPGGGGVVILASGTAVGTWPTVYVAPGGAPNCTVPEAIGQGGTCTQEPMSTLGVTGGAFSGTATVVTAGAGCGTGTGMTWVFAGGGGAAGSAVFNPTFVGGALSSATVTPGTSSGYTAATFTTCGPPGAAIGTGWYAEWAAGVQVH